MKCSHQYNQRLYQFNSVSLYQCQNCQIIFSDRYEKEKFDVKKIYNNYYKNEIAGRFNFGIELIIKLFRFYRALKIFTISPRAKSILDIGSGRGFTLYFLKRFFKYHTVIGTQIEPTALKFSREKLGLDIYGEDLLEINLPENHFNVVTIWHVLEHLKEPEVYLEKIYRLLKKKGRLIIEVPNFDSWTRKLTDKYWLGLDLNYHLNFFTFSSLSNLLKKYKFKIKLVHTFSLEYSTFISVQSIVSKLTNSDQLIFNWLQGIIKFKPILLMHILLFVVLISICFIVNLFLFFSHRGEVLLIAAEKEYK